MELGSDDLIHFAEGFFGFQEYHHYVLLTESEDSTFHWLQSTEEPGLAFIVIKPEIFLKEPYLPEVSAVDLEYLQVSSVKECMIYLIVTIPENHPEKMTANLQGPVLINLEKRIGKQAISMNEKHSVRYPILDQMEG